MSLPEQKDPTCGQLYALSNQLFDGISIEEIRDEIQRMVESYVQYSEVDNLSKANTVSLSHKVINYLVEVERRIERKKTKFKDEIK